MKHPILALLVALFSAPSAHSTDLFLSVLDQVREGAPFSFGAREGIYVGHCFDPFSHDRVSSSALVLMHTSEPVFIEAGLDLVGRGNAFLRRSPYEVANAVSHLRHYYSITGMNPLSVEYKHSLRDPSLRSEMVLRVYGDAIVMKYVYRGPRRELLELRGGMRLPVEPGDTWYACLYTQKITPDSEITLP